MIQWWGFVEGVTLGTRQDPTEGGLGLWENFMHV